jgi:hypothetical protein
MSSKRVFLCGRHKAAMTSIFLIGALAITPISCAYAQTATTTSNVYDSLYGSSASTTSSALNALEGQSYGSTCDPNLPTEANEVAAYNAQRRQTLITNTIVAPSPMACISSALTNFSNIQALFSVGSLEAELTSVATNIANGLINEACMAVNSVAGEITGNFYNQLRAVEQTPFTALEGAGSAVAGAEGSALNSASSAVVGATTSVTAPLSSAATGAQSTGSSSFWSGFFQ